MRPGEAHSARIEILAAALAFLILGAGGAPAAASDLLQGPYFGQPPPGLEPSVFAPGIVSLPDRYEYVIAFAPGGKESCFGVTNRDWSTCDLYCSREENGSWTKPAKAAFQGDGDGWLPSFAPDGRRLLFSSGRPDITKGANAYMCERTKEGWGPPRKLAEPVNSPAMDWRPEIISDGTLFFTSNRDGGEDKMDIYRSVPVNGEYREVEKLPPPVNGPHLDASPFVTLDGQVLFLESWRPGGHGQGDLYVSYLQEDGTWTTPRNLGPEINTEAIEDGGSVSPDGKYFFFNRREGWVTDRQTDIWWIDIRAVYKPYVAHPIGEAKAKAGDRFELQLPAGEFADHDDPSLSYSAAAAGGGPLPGWLAFDPKTRTLKGTPPAEGELKIDVTAADAAGSSCADSLKIRISP